MSAFQDVLGLASSPDPSRPSTPLLPQPQPLRQRRAKRTGTRATPASSPPPRTASGRRAASEPASAFSALIPADYSLSKISWSLGRPRLIGEPIAEQDESGASTPVSTMPPLRNLPDTGFVDSQAPFPLVPPAPVLSNDVAKDVSVMLDWLCTENVNRYDAIRDLHSNLLRIGAGILELNDGMAAFLGAKGPLHSSLLAIKDNVYANAAALEKRLGTIEDAIEEQNMTDEDDPMDPSQPASVSNADILRAISGISARIDTLERRIADPKPRPLSPAPGPKKPLADRISTSSTPATPPSQLHPPPVPSLTLHQLNAEISDGKASATRKSKLKKRVKELESIFSSGDISRQTLTLSDIQAKAQAIAAESSRFHSPATWYTTSSSAIIAPTPINPKGKSVSFTASSPAPSRPTTPARPLTPSASQKLLWQIRFPEPVPLHEQLDACKVWDLLRPLSAPSHNFPINLNRSWWSTAQGKSPSGWSLMLQFSEDTNPAFIPPNKSGITGLLGHGHDVAKLVFQEWAPTSSLFLSNVPYRSPSSNAPYTQDALLLEMGRYPCLKLEFVSPSPRWTPANKDSPLDSPSTKFASVFCQFRDNFARDSLERILATPVYLFGARVFTNTPKKTFEVAQCTRCWKLGKSHEDCLPACVHCGANTHSSQHHVNHCPECAAVGNIDNDVCIHLHCVNCGKSHAATDKSCPSFIAKAKPAPPRPPPSSSHPKLNQPGPGRAGRK